jgi:DNA polymerase-1
LATDDCAPVYVPISHRYLSAPPQLAIDDAPPSLREVLTDPDISIVCHDYKTTLKALRRLGLYLGGVKMDTMLAAYLLDSSGDGYGLKQVAATLGIEVESRVDLVGKGKSAIGFENVPVERAAEASGRAGRALLRLAPVLSTRLAKAGADKLLSDLELPLARILAGLEETGICLDTSFLSELATEVGAQIAELERKAYELAGEQFNLGSPKQLSTLLFDKLGLTPLRKKKRATGYSTDHETLESLRDAHEIIPPLLEFRELVKLKGTYIDALPPLVNPNTGRLHTTFRQAVAATGRLSSQDPNLQNIPIRTELGRKIRRAFVPSSGLTLVSADYSQIELRVMAHLSGDEVLTRAFLNDVDVHTQTAAEVFGVALDAVGKKERRVAKAVNYGLIYGQSEFGLARALDIPRHEARHYIETYFERFSRVRRARERAWRGRDHSGA